MIVSPSILAADFNNLDLEMKKVNDSSCEWVHLDVMDGKFVPATTFDEKLVKKLRPISNKVFDVHLMIETPEKYLMKYYEAGADYVTFHFEACDNIKEVLETLKKQNLKVGLSIKPGTCVNVLDEFLPYLDLILIMSVEPGKGGQKFMESCLEKIAYLVNKRKEFNYNYLVEVDGGINNETAKLVKQVGCDAVVAGTYLFKNENFIKATFELGEI